MPVVSNFLNPDASTSTLYSPMGMVRMAYWPSLLETTWKVALVPVLVARGTVAPGTTAPVGSRTTPPRAAGDVLCMGGSHQAEQGN